MPANKHDTTLEETWPVCVADNVRHVFATAYLATPWSVYQANQRGGARRITNGARERSQAKEQKHLRCNGLDSLVWSGLVWSGLVWSGLAWPGLAWPGLAWPAWPGLAWPGLAWPGLAWPGLACCLGVLVSWCLGVLLSCCPVVLSLSSVSVPSCLCLSVKPCVDLTPLHLCTVASCFQPCLPSDLSHALDCIPNALAFGSSVPQNRVAFDMVAERR